MARFTLDHRERYVAVRDTQDPGRQDQLDMQSAQDPDVVACWYGKKDKDQLGYWNWEVDSSKVKMAHQTCQLLNDAHDSLATITAGHDRICNAAAGYVQERDEALERIKTLEALHQGFFDGDRETREDLQASLANQRVINRDLSSLADRLRLDRDHALESVDTLQQDIAGLERGRDLHNREAHEMQTKLDKTVVDCNQKQDALRRELNNAHLAIARAEDQRETADKTISGLHKTVEKQVALVQVSRDPSAEVNKLQAKLVSSERNHDAVLGEITQWQTRHDELEQQLQRYRYGLTRAIGATYSTGTRELLQRILQDPTTPLDKTMASVERGLEQARAGLSRAGEFVPGPDMKKAQEVADQCQADPRQPDEVQWTRKLPGLNTRLASQDGLDLVVWPTVNNKWCWKVTDDNATPDLIKEGKAASVEFAMAKAEQAARDEIDDDLDDWGDLDPWDSPEDPAREEPRQHSRLRRKPHTPLGRAAAATELAERYEANGEPTEVTTQLLVGMTALIQWAKEN